MTGNDGLGIDNKCDKAIISNLGKEEKTLNMSKNLIKTLRYLTPNTRKVFI